MQHVNELRKILLGEVTAQKHTRDFFSTDGSVFRILPSFVIYPKNEKDVRKALHHLAIAAQEGHGVGLTSRGKGSDVSGGAIGSGAMMIFPTHMNRLVGINKYTVTVQPGMTYAHLQDILHSHDRFLPPYPESMDFATVGGAVANNAAGEKSVKYGTTRDYVEKLRVVLSNGDVIETRRLNKKELESKKRQDDFEGHIYRNIDYLLEENRDLILGNYPKVTKNSAGYDLWRVKNKDGSFDLSQLIIGSQGTLGVVTEITFRHKAYNPKNTLVVGCFETIVQAGEAIRRLAILHPSAFEMVDLALLRYMQNQHPHTVNGLLPQRLPEIMLLVEFDDLPLRKQTAKVRRAERILTRLSYSQHSLTDPDRQAKYWRLYRSGALAVRALGASGEGKKALPIINDGIVPIEKMPEFIHKLYDLFEKYKLDVAIWGHAGDGNLSLAPLIDLSSAADRKRMFSLMNSFYRMVIELGGSTGGQLNDGRLRGPYLKRLYGLEMYELFCEIKKVFDPLGYLNPGVKLGATVSEAAKKLRKEYSLKSFSDHLPNF